ncbi:SH3 domain-containing protein [Fulvivirga sediminis]|uniref:SH3 domain-containing protein n=1 Tax=Fulvivirga sediminis TaxID=2803949 RepID=A0A937F6A3_9BACT|nr:SH3 domain-containing protein [Fulvivirga sediminis]MBL3654868.1 SH3 domain-containing protein [Fulvivirga sediminis]
MKVLIFLSIILFSYNAHCQVEYLVTAKNGLSIRSQPSNNAKQIGKLSFGDNIHIIENTNHPMSIEKRSGYWVGVSTPDGIKGYVFNGYLKPYTKNEISYFLNRKEGTSHQELRATINDKDIVIISYEEKQCFEIVETQDYDYNGYEEVLIEFNACGGNCCGNSFIIFSYNGSNFTASDQIGYDFDGIELNYDNKNVRSFLVDEQNEGYGNTTLCEDKKGIYL